jgi:hypothetical protein
VADPESLVLVQVSGGRGRPSSSFSYPQFVYMREHVWGAALAPGV